MAKKSNPKITADLVLVVGIIILVVFAGIIYLSLMEKFSAPITISLEDVDRVLYEGEIKEFIILSKRFVKNHDYNQSGYNCVNYTNDLYEMSKSLGFEINIIRGCPENSNNESCHEFLRLSVDFEPQMAEFTDYSKKYPDQEILKKS